MLVSEIIKKKRQGLQNSFEELQFLMEGYTRGTIPDYQVSAWLMAVVWRGMTELETYHLTDLMMKSGHVMDFSSIPKPKVDKHSTGGVGDKTTLIVGPLVAAMGMAMPTIAGRGLGHTGGTLDKLEAIPGLVSRLESKKFQSILENHGLCFMGQTEEICPTDKKLYALRDVTSTIESLPLICASIMSKKLAEGLNCLVLDVKCGSGAFMKTEEEAVVLAESLGRIGLAAKKKVTCLVTDMNQPLGNWIGNSLEVEECIRILKNEPLTPQESRTRELSIQLAAELYFLAQESGNENTLENARDVMGACLRNGSAWTIFEKVCCAQGGDLKNLPHARFQRVITSQQRGFISEYNCEGIGNAAISLKAGRTKISDDIDPSSGIRVHFGLGDRVEIGQELYTMYSSNESLFDEAQERLRLATTIGEIGMTPKPLVIRRFT